MLFIASPKPAATKKIPSISAPAASRMLVNVAGSMRVFRNASRHSTELAANALIAVAVRASIRSELRPSCAGIAADSVEAIGEDLVDNGQGEAGDLRSGEHRRDGRESCDEA
jgi:hypothetical protein